MSLLKDEYLNEIGVPKIVDNTQLIPDINQRCTVLSQGSFKLTFGNENSLFDNNIVNATYIIHLEGNGRYENILRIMIPIAINVNTEKGAISKHLIKL